MAGVTDGGTTYTTAQDWTLNANQFVWTPNQATTLYRVRAAARSAGSTSVNGEGVGSSSNYSIVGGPVSAATLSANKSSPQPPNTAITWTATATGGTAPLYYSFV